MCTDKTECVSVAGYDDIETSPYEDIELELVRNSEVTKLASIVAGTSYVQHSVSGRPTIQVHLVGLQLLTESLSIAMCDVSALLYPIHH